MKKSGRTKTYQERIDAGLTPVFVWLTPEAAAALDEAVEASGGSKTSVIENLLTSKIDKRPPPAPKKRADAMPGTPAELAERVRAGASRREAVVLATGQVAADGRVRAAR